MDAAVTRRWTRPVTLTVLGIVYFWVAITLIGLNAHVLGNTLRPEDSTSRTLIMLGSLALGVALGAILASKPASGKVEFGLVPLGFISTTIEIF